MALYHYKAITTKGRYRRGNLDAANVADLEYRLGRMGLDLITCTIRDPRKPIFGMRRIQRIDLINFCFHMEQLLESGVPLLEGLVDLRDSVNHPRFQEIIANLIDEVEGGKTLSGAMAEHPAVFDTLFINMVIAGEVTGQLGQVFAALTKNIKWQDELIATTKKLLLFPAFVGMVVLGVTLFMMIYLVPQLAGLIRDMGGEIPWYTRALIVTSNFCIHFWYLLLMVPVATVTGLRWLATRSPRVRYRLDQFKISVWLIGPVVRKILLSRFAKFFSMMYAAAIPVLQCLEISEGIVGNAVIREALEEVGDDIRSGFSIAASFDNSNLFPPLVVRMLKVGETTGALDQALLNVSYFYDRDIDDAVAKAQALVEPAMTVLLGAILGWVMLSVLRPIYEMISKLNM